MELQIGVVGLGAIGRDHVKRLTERITGCKVAAVSEMNEELGRKVAQQYNAKFYADGEELINSPEVQAVMVTTWDPAHAQYVPAAIRAGKYVFCEKPLATAVSECETILAEEKKYVSGQVVLPRQSRISAGEGLQDPQIMMLRTKKGICIDVEISQSSGYGYDIQCEVVGDLGTIRLPDPPTVITKTDCTRTTAIM